ncbi:MAG: hypothetical protein QXR53_04310 [Candidatus Norongarragalinales archaeon]
MKTLFPCEEIVRKYLPAMRASIAKKLYRKGLKQERIARELGLTQAAVSKYLSNAYGKEIRKVEDNAVLDKACEEIADKVSKGRWTSKHVTNAICSTCTQFNYELLSCNLLDGFEKAKAVSPVRV